MKNLTEFDFDFFTKEREKATGVRGSVVWFTGLSASGKSTLANELISWLAKNKNVYAISLDGDSVRKGLSSDLGFSQEDRSENLRRIAYVAKLLADQGHMVICSFISPLNEQRNKIREIIGEKLVMYYVNCPFEVCQKRDPKGLYSKSDSIANFSGKESKFETPDHYDLELKTDQNSISELSQNILSNLKEKSILHEIK